MRPAGFDPRRHHHGFAEKQRGLLIVGVAVQVHRVAGLHQAPVAHHRQLIGKRQRFALVVGHQDGGDAGVASRRATVLRMAARRPVSSAENGSSSSISRGCWASARASATRCCWPPDSSCGQRRAMSASRATLSISSAMRCCFAPPLRGQAEADVGGHRQVREQRAVLRHVADPALVGRHRVGAVDQDLAVEVTLPASGNSKPAIMRSSVVLPEPEGPTIAVRLPAGTDR